MDEETIQPAPTEDTQEPASAPAPEEASPEAPAEDEPVASVDDAEANPVLDTYHTDGGEEVKDSYLIQ